MVWCGKGPLPEADLNTALALEPDKRHTYEQLKALAAENLNHDGQWILQLSKMKVLHF